MRGLYYKWCVERVSDGVVIEHWLHDTPSQALNRFEDSDGLRLRVVRFSTADGYASAKCKEDLCGNFVLPAFFESVDGQQVAEVPGWMRQDLARAQK